MSQAADVPATVGVGAQLTLLAFLVIMLVVPWIMSRGSSEDEGRFGSDQERRLWLWTGLVLVAIYSTLGPVQELAAALRDRNLLGATSGVFLALVAAYLSVPWLKRRPGPRELGAAIGVAAVYATTLIRLPVPEARSHLFEYGLVGLLIYHALMARRRSGRRVVAPAASAVIGAALFGWIDEGIQALLPNRVYDIADVGFNALAAFMAVGAAVVMAWARRTRLKGNP